MTVEILILGAIEIAGIALRDVSQFVRLTVLIVGPDF